MSEQSFDEWFAVVKTEFAKNGIALPEDIEMMEMAHMEYLESGKSQEEFMQQLIAEYKGSN
ncbi:MAG: hypothetical protein JNM14_02245 [Ferruginibacter sp.]|nr:hypothetical protein [Ferruginibacter sp.]